MKSAIGNRITVSKKDKETIIKISGTIEPWMNHALLGWLVMWTIMGAYVVYYVITGKTEGENMFYFFLTYLAFWGYFEIKAFYSWMFRAYGYELVKITPSEIFVKRSLFGYGKSKRYDRENVKDFRKVETSRKSVNAAFNKSFWVMGNEQIEFDSLGQAYGFGMHLEEKERNELLVFLRRLLKKKV